MNPTHIPAAGPTNEPPDTPPKTPTDIRRDQELFGRTDELFQLVANLRRGRHTLLVGEKGVGKSRLMLEAKRILSGRCRRLDLSAGYIARRHGQLVPSADVTRYKILAVAQAAPQLECLKELAEQLFRYGDLRCETAEERDDWGAISHDLSRLGISGLQSCLLEGVAASGQPYVIFFDSLDRISPGQLPFLESLLDIAVLCAAVVEVKESPLYRRLWGSFARIEIEPLSAVHSAGMIDHLLTVRPFNLVDSDLYRGELLKAANGNPFRIKSLLWHASREKNLGLREIRSLRRVDEGKYFNMGPLYIFCAGAFTLFRIFSSGTDRREFYIYFSALGFLVYLTFRVFRTFFIFRPQRRR